MDRGIKVLDAGCGGGTWVLVSIQPWMLFTPQIKLVLMVFFAQTQEMANEYPNSEFTGVDVSVGWPTEIRPRNCDFVVGNIVNELPFADNTFDFVYMRLVGMGVSNGEYPLVLNHLYRVLKPGGWIELVEVRYSAMERRR